MAVALPDLPDDSRARPRKSGPVSLPALPATVAPVNGWAADGRRGPGGPRAVSGYVGLGADDGRGAEDGSARQAADRPVNGRAANGQQGPGQPVNGQAPNGQQGSGQPVNGQPAVAGRPAARGGQQNPPPGRVSPPAHRRSGPANGRSPQNPQTAPPPQGDSRPPAPPSRQGRNGSPNGRQAPPRPLGVPPLPLAAPPAGGPRHRTRGPRDPQPNGAPRSGATPVRTPGRPVIPPQGPPADDRPTTDLGGPVDAPETEAFDAVAPVEPVEAPPAPEAPAATPAGPRRRRRAGESEDERPASTYRSQGPANGKAPRTGRRRRPAFWKELPLLVVVALLLTFLIQTFLAKVYVIPSGSMETTLHGCTGCTNDRVLVDKVSYRFGDPQPGDVVVFRGPDSWSSEIEVDPPDSALLRGLQQFGSLIGLAPPNEKDFVKRVIATGGQTVQCCDAGNRVLVDGKPLEEPYIYYLPEAGRALQQGFGPFVVPRGYLWMMGDSRNNSSDSRATGHGPVPIDNVIGKAQYIVLPMPRFSGIEAVNPQAEPAVGLGADIGAPVALGLLVALPLALRQRLRGRGDDEFLPTSRRRD